MIRYYFHPWDILGFTHVIHLKYGGQLLLSGFAYLQIVPNQ